MPRRGAQTARVKTRALSLLAATFALAAPHCRAAEDVPFADFEGGDYGAWKVEGTAFGTGPARGGFADQMPVEGFRGKGLVDSYLGRDESTGKLTSPEFQIGRRFIFFLIGGGGYEGKTCINLIVDGKAVRTAAGPNTQPGGNERLAPSGWDVSELAGKMARLEIVDAATGGWGHINVDDIAFTDTKPPLAARLLRDVAREIAATERWMNFPVKNGAKKRTVTLRAEGKEVRHFEIELADAEPDWWAPVDLSAWGGKMLSVSVNELPDNSRGLAQVAVSGEPAGTENLYREALRPQFHFSAKRGWLNDPNGMVFYNGEYHLFFQHSPFTWGDGPKYWGQAVSRDMVHWEEIGEALAPDELGAMWSGSAAVDWKNTSGFGKGGKPPLVLIYTASGNPFTQCIAYSTDGRTFTKYAGNPVLKNITGGNRDPKIFWHEGSQRWVLALYVEKEKHHTIHFFTSPNLREWTFASVTDAGPNGGNFLFECPDFFELPLDGDAKNTRWILTAANTEYAVGTFDGTKFTAETPKLPGHRGGKPNAKNWDEWGYYAPQTFNDEPHGRRIQIGWFQTPTPGMPFNQSMSVPMELHLMTTPDGLRLTWTPVKELEALRAKSHTIPGFVLQPGAANPLGAIAGELLEIRAEFEPGEAAEVTFNVRGVPVTFDAAKQEIVVNGRRAPALLHGSRQRVTIYADRTGLEVFTNEGQTFVPMPVNLKPENLSLGVSAKGGSSAFTKLDVHELRSAWAPRER